MKDMDSHPKPLSENALLFVSENGAVTELLDQKDGSDCGRYLQMPRCQTVFGICGAAGRYFRGWGHYGCELLSPRRFAQAHGNALLQGKTSSELLTADFRSALAEIFTEMPHDPAREEISDDLREVLYRLAMNRGWLLTEFHLEYAAPTKEEDREGRM